MSKMIKKPLATAIGAAFVASLALPVMAGSNPFTANPLSSGYDLVSKAETAVKLPAEGKKPAEAVCGEGRKAVEARCGTKEICAEKLKMHAEGKCGDPKRCEDIMKEANKAVEGKCGDMEKCKVEGKCGEGKCGDEKNCNTEKAKSTETKTVAPAGKAADEGKCGEGKCGSM